MARYIKRPKKEKFTYSNDNKYAIYLKKGSEKIRFPVNPEEINIENPGDNAEYNVIGIGQIAIPRTPKLKKVAWEGLFPGTSEKDSPYVSDGYKDPEYLIEKLTKYMRIKTTLRLIINRYDDVGGKIFDTNMQVLIEKFDIKEVGGETGDFYYDIELTEYRDYTPNTITIVTPPPPTSESEPAAEATAVTEPDRPAETGALFVGAKVIANGKWWYDSYGSKPFGNANGRSGTIVRIVDTSRPKPYLFSQGSTTSGTGWMAAEDFTFP